MLEIPKKVGGIKLTTETFERNTNWHWRDLFSLLFLALVFVPFFIEHSLYNTLLELFQNELYAGTSIGLIMSFIFMAALFFFVLKPKNQSWAAVGVRPFSPGHWKLIAVWTFILILVSVGLVMIMSFMGIGSDNSKTESLQTDMNVFNFIIAFVSAAVISPVYEEIFYRGFLYRFFQSRYGILSGMLFSSVIFTIVHIPTYNTLPVNFVSGLIFAWVYQKTGSVIPSIIIHGVFNGIAVILTAIA